MQEIKYLSEIQINEIIANHSIRKKNKKIVENFLISLSTEYTKEEAHENASYEADINGLDTGEYNAMRDGVDTLFL
jgi:hypothetical protein